MSHCRLDKFIFPRLSSWPIAAEPARSAIEAVPAAVFLIQVAHRNLHIVSLHQQSLQPCRYCDRPVVAALAEEGSTIVLAVYTGLVVLIVALQDFLHQCSYARLVPNHLKNLIIGAGAVLELPLSCIAGKVAAVENAIHANVA